MVQMGAYKSTFLDIPTMELGDTIPARAGSPFQVLHQLRSLRGVLHGTHVSRAHAHVFSVRFQEFSVSE